MIRVVTLPGLRAYAGPDEVSALQGRRLPLALLAYLAVERSAARESVLGVFWPERDEERARHSLSQTLYELRRELGAAWLPATGDVLAVDRDVETDLGQFEAAVEGGRWGPALQLYGGGFLDGLSLVPTHAFEDWVERRRAQVARLHRRARRERVAELLRAGDLAGALAAAARWAELEPLDDEAQQRCIELLARSGRRAEALSVFESFEARLREEELEPMPELARLVEGIRAGTAELAAVPAPPDGSAAPGTVPTPATSAAAPLPGLAPDLEVVRLLAEGSQARVYLAREPALGRLVAIKVLAPPSVQDAVAVRRFQREARALARIHHPNVAPVFRSGMLTGGAWYLVMPYVDGGSLEDRLAARGPLPEIEAARVIRQLASALAAAHRFGIVHRDVRPGNVLYERGSDRVLLMDFGIAGLLESGESQDAQLTRPGETLGVPGYASPEQLRGDVVTDRSDVYSLGVVAFELLTGRLPFETAGALQMVAAHAAQEPPALASLRPDVAPGLARLVQRCLEKRPERRPYAEEIVQAVRGHEGPE